MFNPSIKLLLACAAPSPDTAQISELLGKEIDWDLLLEQAGWHCVAPLLFRSLRDEPPNLVPPAVLASLQSFYEENFRNNLFMAGRMIRLATMFRERDIPVVAYKGPVLCGYYQDLGMRQFGDLDFLVKPEDVARADELLRQDGFQPHMYRPCAQESRTLPFAQAFHYEMVYTSATSGVKVDLHWALMPGFWALSDDAAEIWQRTRAIGLGGGTVASLSHDDTLLLLCAHGTKHSWRSLGWICDVAALLAEVPGLNWHAVLERAEVLRIVRAVHLGLHLASRLSGAILPAELLQGIEQDQEARRLADTVLETLFDPDPKPESVFANCSFLMRTRENTRDSVRCVVEQVFQPTMAEWQSIALPNVLFPAYYLLRPIRLLGKYLSRSRAGSA